MLPEQCLKLGLLSLTNELFAFLLNSPTPLVLFHDVLQRLDANMFLHALNPLDIRQLILLRHVIVQLLYLQILLSFPLDNSKVRIKMLSPVHEILNPVSLQNGV